VVDQVFPLDAAAAAPRLIKSRVHIGQIMLHIAD